VLEFSLQVKKIGATSVTLDMAASAADQVRVRMEQTMVLFSFDAGQTMPIPNDMRENLQRYCHETS
jgi:4-hydroxybenzoyl-CoA thioesterase